MTTMTTVGAGAAGAAGAVEELPAAGEASVMERYACDGKPTASGGEAGAGADYS